MVEIYPSIRRKGLDAEENDKGVSDFPVTAETLDLAHDLSARPQSSMRGRTGSLCATRMPTVAEPCCKDLRLAHVPVSITKVDDSPKFTRFILSNAWSGEKGDELGREEPISSA